MAFVSEDKAPNVKIPGWYASPRTKILIDLSFPNEIFILVPILFALIISDNDSWSWLKVSPATEMGPISGKNISPSLLTWSVNWTFSLPYKIILRLSSGPIV